MFADAERTPCLFFFASQDFDWGQWDGRAADQTHKLLFPDWMEDVRWVAAGEHP